MRVWPLWAVACGAVDTGPRLDFPMCDPDEVVEIEGTPTWSADVAPLLAEACVGCHQPGGSAPFSLATYEDASAWAPALGAAVASRQMPPPGPSNCGACNRFTNAHWLDAADVAAIRAWADAGAPAGDPLAAPAPPAEPVALDRSDRVVSMPEAYTPRDDVDDDYRCFVVDAGLDRDQFLTGFEVRPGDERVVHHVILYALGSDAAAAAAQEREQTEDGPGYPCFGGAGVSGASFVAGWAPGLGATVLPDGVGIGLPAARPMVLQIHYNLAEGAHADQSDVVLQLADEVRTEAVMETYSHGDFTLPPGQERVVEEVYVPALHESYEDEATIWGVIPHMHLRGRAMGVEVWGPDGRHQCVADVPRYDFHWQGLFMLDEPLVVRGSDRMRITCVYDTTDATEPVRSGEGTDDEMCVVILLASAARP